MISVRDGQNHILSRITATVAPELVPVTRALGRVLAEDFQAPFDVPPADNSAVDGYAVASADIPAAGTSELVVVADLAAGSIFDGRLTAGQALRIMTGAPMPAGADTVYPQEIVERDDRRVRIGPLAKGANVRLRGEDVEAGAIVIETGTVLRPQEIGLVTSLGAWQLMVYRRPRVALMSTGDEVAEPGTPRRPGQIYDANRFTLRGSIEQCGGEVIDLGIVPDERETLRARLHEAAAGADVVLTSGGVSVGVYDLVKEVLAEVGAIDFWQVAMQPGRPLAVGSIGAYGFIVGGWASDSKYALLGSMRTCAQLVSYEVALALSVLGVVIMAGSLSLTEIVAAQSDTVWYAVPQFVGLVVFLFAGTAETARAPFDLPEAEQELVAGYHTEYGGMRFGLYTMSEYINLITLSALCVTLFLGGWHGPGWDGPSWLGPIWFLAKLVVLLYVFIWMRTTLPRLRYDQLMRFGWKVLLPVATVNAIVTALLVVAL